MRMQHALDIVTGCVNRAVNDEACRIDWPGTIDHLVALHVDFHQARGRDFVEHHAVRINEKMMLRSRYPRGDMGEYQVVPMEMRDQTISGRQIDTNRPLLWGIARCGTAGSRYGFQHVSLRSINLCADSR